jgi:hypothetical protein
VYVWEGGICFFQLFFAVATSTFITNAFIWKEKSKREIREISDGTGRGTVVVLGEVVLSFCISWGVLQSVQGLVFHHHGLSICEDGSVVFFGIVLSCLCLLTSLGTRQCSVIHCIWKGSFHIVFFISCLSCFSHFSSIIKNLGSIATVDILVNSEIEWSWQGDGVSMNLSIFCNRRGSDERYYDKYDRAN